MGGLEIFVLVGADPAKSEASDLALHLFKPNFIQFLKCWICNARSAEETHKIWGPPAMLAPFGPVCIFVHFKIEEKSFQWRSRSGEGRVARGDHAGERLTGFTESKAWER